MLCLALIFGLDARFTLKLIIWGLMNLNFIKSYYVLKNKSSNDNYGFNFFKIRVLPLLNVTY